MQTYTYWIQDRGRRLDGAIIARDRDHAIQQLRTAFPNATAYAVTEPQTETLELAKPCRKRRTAKNSGESPTVAAQPTRTRKPRTSSEPSSSQPTPPKKPS